MVSKKYIKEVEALMQGVAKLCIVANQLGYVDSEVNQHVGSILYDVQNMLVEVRDSLDIYIKEMEQSNDDVGYIERRN